jgi:hypothetical protein
MTTRVSDADPSIRWNLTNHRPTTEGIVLIERLRETAILMGEYMVSVCPDSRERALALTKLEETVMWAVASIARNMPADPLEWPDT